MAIPSAIGTADALILHSGPQLDFETHRSTLDALGTVTYLGADHGLAALYDVAGLSHDVERPERLAPGYCPAQDGRG